MNLFDQRRVTKRALVNEGNQLNKNRGTTLKRAGYITSTDVIALTNVCPTKESRFKEDARVAIPFLRLTHFV